MPRSLHVPLLFSLGLAAALAPGLARASGTVYWSVGVSPSPGVAVTAGNVRPLAPAYVLPQVVAPATVYSSAYTYPAPVYTPPAVIYSPPPVVYTPPRVIYTQPVVTAAPVYIVPAPGWHARHPGHAHGHGHGHRHHHGDGPGRYRY